MKLLTPFGLVASLGLLVSCAPASTPAPMPVAVSAITAFESEILAFESQDRAALPTPGGIVFVGSSTFRLWSTMATDFPGQTVLNRGFGGSTLREVNTVITRIVTPPRPHLVVLYAGDNDLAAGHTPTDVLGDYRRFVSIVRRELPGVRIAFVSIKPSPSRWALIDRMRVANRLVREEIARDARSMYVDTFTAMLRADGRPRPELFGPDSLHLSRAGYALWRETLAPVVH